MGVRLQTVSHKTIKFWEVSKPPNHALPPVDMDALLAAADSAIVAGNLNAKNFAYNSRVMILNVDDSGKLTHFGATGRPDVLDIIVVLKEVLVIHQLTTVSELDSDYNLVLSYLSERRDGSVGRTTTVSWSASGLVPVLYILSLLKYANSYLWQSKTLSTRRTSLDDWLNNP